MSRFQKAMERDRAGGTPRRADLRVILPDEIPASELFDAPWHVVEAAGDGRRTAAPKATPSPVAADAAAASAAAPAPAPQPVPIVAPGSTSARRPATRVTGLRLRPDLAEKVVSDAATSAVVVEQYRSIAAHLQRWRRDSGRATLMVASAVAGEGRTLTALNLAVALRSALQQSVLLVDADLRQPNLHDLLLVERRPGLGEALLSGEAPCPTEVSNRLFVLPAGQPVSTPGAAALGALIERSIGEFDWVILDTSPLLDSPDAMDLATLVDGVVLVAAAGRTSRHLVAAAMGRIPRHRFAGLVLNGVAGGDMDAAEQHRYRSQR